MLVYYFIVSLISLLRFPGRVADVKLK